MKLIYWGETLWVHESVLESLTLEQIEETVRANNNHVQRVFQKPRLVFNVETGKLGKGTS
eukprot:scaffold22595_cov102-Cylindrotheca_fusiformis.AAC.1